MTRFARLLACAALASAVLAAPAPLARRQCAPTSTSVSVTSTELPLPPVTSDAPETTPVPEPTPTPTPTNIPPEEPAPTETEAPPPAAETTDPPAPEETPAADPNLVCNGDARLCERKYSEVTFVGTHNSYAIDGKGGLPGVANVASNQYIDVPAQLEMGIRFLQAQTHVAEDVLRVCHTSCSLYDGGSLEDWLKQVNSFLTDEKNRNEVVTLLITNPENYPIEKWADIFKSSGLESLVYTPSSEPGTRENWPTMGQLITDNTRVVVFMDYNSDQTKVPYINNQFRNMWESKFDEVDENFPCSVDRVEGDAGPKLGLINHYLDTELFGILMPDRDAAPQTNSVASITAQVDRCKSLGDNFRVSHVLLDWADKGEAIAAQRKLNGLD